MQASALCAQSKFCGADISVKWSGAKPDEEVQSTDEEGISKRFMACLFMQSSI